MDRRSTERSGQQGRSGLLSLQFADPPLERRFLDSFTEASLPLVRLAVGMGILLTIAFGGVDIWLVGDRIMPALFVRAVLLALLVLMFWATFRPWFSGVQRLAGLAACVVATLAFDLMTIVAPMPPGYAAFAALLTVVFLSTIRSTVGFAAVGAALTTLGLLTTTIINHNDVKTVGLYMAFVVTFLCPALGACYMLERLRRREFLAEIELAEARARSDQLLHNILPDEIAERLRVNPAAIAATAEEVSVIFADIVNFTPLSATLSPTELVGLLDRLFCEFDELCDLHGIEKIKTIGDAYMGVAGLPSPTPDHAAAAAEMALDMLQATRQFEKWPGELTLRIGISSGPVVAGVIGQRKFAYDLWGDTVNTASRMESHGSPGIAQVSAKTFRLLEGRYVFGPPLQTTVKGKGVMTTHHLLSR